MSPAPHDVAQSSQSAEPRVWHYLVFSVFSRPEKVTEAQRHVGDHRPSDADIGNAMACRSGAHRPAAERPLHLGQQHGGAEGLLNQRDGVRRKTLLDHDIVGVPTHEQHRDVGM